MIRLILFFLAILAIAAGLHWLADRPGTIVIEWQQYVAETSVFGAIVILLLSMGAVMAVSFLLRWLWSSPAAVGQLLHRRRARRGLDALASGMIAVGAGDRTLAIRYAGQARKALPNEPLTHLLRAQTAELTGDRATARRIFEAMLASPDTEQLGLRGLFLEAQREGEREASRQFAERALALNPRLGWPVEALFQLHCREGDWEGALLTLAVGRRHHLIDKSAANRRRAVLLTALAQPAEDTDPEGALELAREAHNLAPDPVPAAAIAGRILASQGKTPRAARVLLRTWRLSPHPELAAAYAHARPGDSPRDRLSRMRHLCRLTPHDNEGPIALAIAAIDAREWDEARKALAPLQSARLTQRVCTLMARIEGEQYGHAGRVREWLARAVNAARDPAWTVDGVVAERWAPVSPVTGALDAFRWRVPLEAMDKPAGALVAAKVEELVSLGAGQESGPGGVVVTARGAEATAALEQMAPPVSDDGGKPVMAARGSVPSTIEPAQLRNPARRQAQQSDAAQDQGLPDPFPQARAANLERSPMRPAPATAPKDFVPPRAPDDPGPDASGDDFEFGPYQSSGVKA